MASSGLEQLLVSVMLSVLTYGREQGKGQLKEMCTNEIYKATCGPDEIISITEARYGRMNKSRCVVKDYGFIGCYGDVLHIADDMCSGRHSCSIRVPNELLDAVRTECPEDFKSYFEARHICVKVASPHHGGCRKDVPVILTEPEGTISSIVTSETRCGTPHSPWIIQVRPGQRVNITLVDYSYGAQNNVADHTKCYAYATVKDLSTQRSSTVCGGRTRESHVYTSIGNRLQVVLFGVSGDSSDRYFSLKYKALGCPDPSSLNNGWFRRQGDKLTVGCNDSTETFVTRCNGTHWDKMIKNCSVHAASKGQHSIPFMFSMSYEIAIVIILAIALIIASAILCVGIICMRRLQEERARQRQHRMYTERQQQYMTRDLEISPHKAANLAAPCLASYEQYRTGENLYASIQENVLPPCSSECKLQNNEVCTCRHEMIPREVARGTGSGPYSSLEQSVCANTCAIPPEPISPTSRSECSSIFPETGRPYYVLDPRETDPDLP